MVKKRLGLVRSESSGISITSRVFLSNSFISSEGEEMANSIRGFLSFFFRGTEDSQIDGPISK
jgi:hypothetical protein